MNDLEIDDKVNHGDLSRTLADKLRDHIREKALKPGSRLPSNRDIAQMANVSQVTARMAIKRLEKEGLLECRMGQGSFVRCLPQRTEPGHKATATFRIGVVLSPWDNSSKQLSWDNQALVGGLLNEFCQASSQLIIFSYQQWLDYAQAEPFNLIAENNLNVLIWLHSSIREAAFIARLEERGFKQILLNRRTLGLNCPAVLQDEVGMINDLVGRMTAAERDNYLVICGDPGLSPYQERYGALKEQLEVRNQWDAARILHLPEAPYPEWTAGILREYVLRFHPAIIIDLIGYMEKLAAVLEHEKEMSAPHCISVFPPTAWDHPRQFDYDYYTFALQSVGQYVSELLNGQTQTLMLPFTYHSVQ